MIVTFIRQHGFIGTVVIFNEPRPIKNKGFVIIIENRVFALDNCQDITLMRQCVKFE